MPPLTPKRDPVPPKGIQQQQEDQGLLLLALAMGGGGAGNAIVEIEHMERAKTNGVRVKMPWCGDEVLALKMRQGMEYDTLYMARRMPKEAMEALVDMGFLFYDMQDDPDKSDDDVLQTVRAPVGWRFEPTGDNGYWSNLVDPSGAVHGTQFFKGVFYDRRANFSLN